MKLKNLIDLSALEEKQYFIHAINLWGQNKSDFLAISNIIVSGEDSMMIPDFIRTMLDEINIAYNEVNIEDVYDISINLITKNVDNYDKTDNISNANQSPVIDNQENNTDINRNNNTQNTNITNTDMKSKESKKFTPEGKNIVFVHANYKNNIYDVLSTLSRLRDFRNILYIFYVRGVLYNDLRDYFDYGVYLDLPDNVVRETLLSSILSYFEIRYKIEGMNIYANQTAGLGINHFLTIAREIYFFLQESEKLNFSGNVLEGIISRVKISAGIPSKYKINESLSDDLQDQLYMMAIEQDDSAFYELILMLNSHRPLNTKFESLLSQFPFVLADNENRRLTRYSRAHEMYERFKTLSNRGEK